MPPIRFGKDYEDQYILTSDIRKKAMEAIASALKDEIPEEARRADVICYLFDEMKQWAETQRPILQLANSYFFKNISNNFFGVLAISCMSNQKIAIRLKVYRSLLHKLFPKTNIGW